MKIVAFFNLIRWKNLLLIALMQFLIKFYFLTDFSLQTTLSNSLFYLLVFTTVCITASGYIINDIIDLKVDLINKPKKVIIDTKISIISAKKIYLLFIIIGNLVGIYMSTKIDKPIYSLYFIGITLILYLYSKLLKGKVLIGNVVVSLLLSFSILIFLIFDVPVRMSLVQWNLYQKVELVIIGYAVCAFLLSFIREIIKDIEDIDGDYNEGLKTFPIVFGRKLTKNLAITISFLVILFFIFIIFNLLKIESFAFIYIFILLFLPLLYFIYKLWFSKTKKNYSFLSKLLKIIILLGVISIPIISKYLKHAFE
ncbi:MAG: geranylgeranylglycerol-phosphate geranylgeranyltransferase [Flavobacteriaceae bacterium]|nr:geranylgeranylglycerol-phosphate geranylgeranyltransferase [Flavobacteriaceae bacterium]